MSTRMTSRIVGFALAAVAAAGCAKGPVTGRVTTPGQPESPLTMRWESGLFGESGTMAATMPDGERFKGTYQVVRAGISRSAIPAAVSMPEAACLPACASLSDDPPHSLLPTILMSAPIGWRSAF